jgi:N-hydroxyarylamine O-acetyltransferase
MNELNRLIKDYLSKYPFNNIDILLNPGKILSLDNKDLKEKIQNKKRGGYCFEHNQLMTSLLEENGYEYERSLGRVVYGKPDAIVARTHQCSIVKIESEDFLVDVGFGPYTPAVAVPLNGEEVTSYNNAVYRVVNLDEGNYQLEVLKDGEYFCLYQFNKASYNDSDFKVANYYTNTHPDSKFVTDLVLSQQTEEGVCFISNKLFSKLINKRGIVEREDVDILSSEQLYDTINANFNISLDREEVEKLYRFMEDK